jgi:DNA-binding beta-propeller fold protein YncE
LFVTGVVWIDRNNIQVMDELSGKLLNTFPTLPVTGTPRAIAVDVVRETIYVFIQANQIGAAPYFIVALDERTEKTEASISIPVISQWLSIDEGKGLLYAAGTGYSEDNDVDAPGTAIVIDMRTNKILETVVVFPKNPTGDENTITEEMVPDPASNAVYASSFADSSVVYLTYGPAR